MVPWFAAGKPLCTCIVNICNGVSCGLTGYHWSEHTQHLSVRYQSELHHNIRKAARPVTTTRIYKSSNRWLLFKQTQPCCLNMAAVHVSRSGRQDDSSSRTGDAGLGKMGSFILLVAPDLIFTDPVAAFCISVHGKRQLRDSCYDGISIQPFGHTRFPWSSVSVTSAVLLHEGRRSMITSSASQGKKKRTNKKRTNKKQLS